MEAILVLSFGRAASALAPNNDTTSDRIAPLWVANPNGRGTGDILLTCLATISLCVCVHSFTLERARTWIHSTERYNREAKWILVGIFAPEIVVYSRSYNCEPLLFSEIPCEKVFGKT